MLQHPVILVREDDQTTGHALLLQSVEGSNAVRLWQPVILASMNDKLGSGPFIHKVRGAEPMEE
jgi:hypothetical protein